MKTKEVEKRIKAALSEKTSDKSRLVTERVKEEMAERVRVRKPAFRYATSLLAVLIVVTAIAVPVMVRGRGGDMYSKVEVSSVDEYLKKNTATEPNAPDMSAGEGTHGSEEEKAESVVSYVVKNKKGDVVCIEELYTYPSGVKISMSVLLTDDEKVAIAIFPWLENLSEFEKTGDVGYKFYADKNVGVATFFEGENRVVLTVYTDDEKVFEKIVSKAK